MDFQRIRQIYFGSGDFSECFTYTDRESYLAWVSEWKQEYAALSESIREQRREARKLFGLGRTLSFPEARTIWALETASQNATALLALRKTAKADSWAKRQASLVAV